MKGGILDILEVFPNTHLGQPQMAPGLQLCVSSLCQRELGGNSSFTLIYLGRLHKEVTSCVLMFPAHKTVM